MKDPKKVKMGKASRAAGGRFELKVRKDLESKGWIVSKWMNNCDYPDSNINLPPEEREDMKMFSAKHKFRGIGIPMAIGTGFPDFIVFSKVDILTDDISLIGNESKDEYPLLVYDVMGVEVKSNGYLDKAEKEKCKWLLDNNIFSKILIASKGKKRGEIEYKEVTK